MSQPPGQFPVLRLFRADRRSTVQSLQTAVLYAGQLVLCSIIILEGFYIEGSSASVWAVVAAANVIQPVMQQTISASCVQIAANIVGATAGIVIDHFYGDGIWQFCVALILVVFICEFIKLDEGLRTACTSLAVIMIMSDGLAKSNGLQRLIAVIAGCITAAIIQVLAELVRTKVLRWKVPDFPSTNPLESPAVETKQQG